MTPLVSVITPTWQRHGYLLGRCIPSVLAQDYPRVEHVIVSDGPDPELGELLMRQVYPKAGHRMVYDELPDHDLGNDYGSRPRRRGLELATGDLIAYLDDDDAYRPQHCSVLAKALTAAPGMDFAYSLMSSQGAVVGTDPPGFCHIGTPMIMHRQDTTARFGTWGPDSRSEDWDLVERWLAAGARYVHVPDVTIDVWPSAYRWQKEESDLCADCLSSSLQQWYSLVGPVLPMRQSPPRTGRSTAATRTPPGCCSLLTLRYPAHLATQR